MKRTMPGLIVAGAFAGGVPAYAHHSFAATYFEDKSLTIEGKLVDFDFRNPHSFVTLEVPNGEGKVETWAAEWRSSGRLIRDGLSKDRLHAGDHVVITGSPGRTATERRIHLKAISRPSDGFKWNQGNR